MILLLLLFLRAGLAFDLPRDGCNSDLRINNDHYNASNTYFVGDAFPTDAHYDVYGNLFYVESGRNDEGFFFNVHVIRFETSAPQKVKGLPESLSYSIAVDKKNTKVFFGTAKGIYTYDYESHTASPLSTVYFKLSMIFVDKDGKRYITESNNGVDELYRLDGEKKVHYENLDALNGMTIDDKNNFYYIKNDKLCILKADTKEPNFMGKISYNGIAQISFHEDKVFIASENLTYIHINDVDILKLVTNTPGKVTAIAFDKTGDFILGVHGKLIKYKKNNCYTNNENNADQTLLQNNL